MLLNPDDRQYLSGRRIDSHDGRVFCCLKDAQEYAIESIKDNYCTRFVIGVFCLDKDAETMCITHVETFGFKNDKKSINQLELF